MKNWRDCFAALAMTQIPLALRAFPLWQGGHLASAISPDQGPKPLPHLLKGGAAAAAEGFGPGPAERLLRCARNDKSQFEWQKRCLIYDSNLTTLLRGAQRRDNLFK